MPFTLQNHKLSDHLILFLVSFVLVTSQDITIQREHITVKAASLTSGWIKNSTATVNLWL